MTRIKRTIRDSAKVLGIAMTGHGASVAYLDRSGEVRCSVLDRWVGVKHTMMFAADEERAIRLKESPIDAQISNILTFSFGRFPETRTFEGSFPQWLEWLLRGLNTGPCDIDLVVTSAGNFGTNWARLGRKLENWFPNAIHIDSIEHHEVHQRQAFWPSGFDEAAILTLDTCGEPLNRLSSRKLSGTIAYMNQRGEAKTLREFFFPECSAGLIYATLNHHIGFRQGEEGKTMGLAPYGNAELYEALRCDLRLRCDGGFDFIPQDKLQMVLDQYVKPRRPTRDAEILPRHRNVAFAAQGLIEAIVDNAFQAALNSANVRDLTYAGGLALNSVANGKCRPRVSGRLYIPPNPGDTGHALGCALYGAYECAKWEPRRDELPEYLGPPYSVSEVEAALPQGACFIEQPEAVDSVAAKCIANGYILGRMAGRAEFGPRALGNRSILCDPRRPWMKRHLNATVKHREEFRPFAPTVLEDCAREWFEMNWRESYMLGVVPVRTDKRDRIPAVVHVDGTARVQTICRSEEPSYFGLVSQFWKETEVPLLLNTSFNVAGKPIVETPNDAVQCFLTTPIDILILGPYILSKRPLCHYTANEFAP